MYRSSRMGLTWFGLLCAVTCMKLGSSCETWEFRCENGDCVKGSARCNGQRQCGDGSDEFNCPPLEETVPWTPTPCTGYTFVCDNKRCITRSWRCDKTDDCGDNSDERDCPTKGSGNNVLTEASVIGLSVAIVGLFAILVVVIIMVTCARKKIDRARANRTSTHGLQDTTGPYGGYFVGQTMPEPPPRYSSQPDLSVHSVSSTSFTPFPLCNVPPPQYSPYEKPPPRPSPNEPPPTYSSYPDLNTALVETSMHSDAGMTGFDNPALDTEERSTPIQYNSYKESSQRNLKAQPNLRSASSSGLSQGPEKPRVNSALNLSHDDPEKAKLEATAYGGARKNSAESLYAGLTEADRSLLQNIMLTVPSEVLQRADSTEQLDLIKPRKMPAKSDHWASEPAILETRHRAQPFHGSKSYGQLDELEELPPLRHSYSQHSQLLSSSDSAQQHQVTPLDFHSSQPLCISTPKQTSPRRLQLFPSTYNIDPDTEGSDNETKEDYLKASAC